jgi:hypothetical protein
MASEITVSMQRTESRRVVQQHGAACWGVRGIYNFLVTVPGRRIAFAGRLILQNCATSSFDRYHDNPSSGWPSDADTGFGGNLVCCLALG